MSSQKKGKWTSPKSAWQKPSSNDARYAAARDYYDDLYTMNLFIP